MNILIDNYNLIARLVIYCYNHDIQLNILSDTKYCKEGELIDDSFEFEKCDEIIDRKNGIYTNFKGEEYRVSYKNIESMLKYIPRASITDNKKYYYLPYIYPFIIKNQFCDTFSKSICDPNVEIINRNNKDIILIYHQYSTYHNSELFNKHECMYYSFGLGTFLCNKMKLMKNKVVGKLMKNIITKDDKIILNNKEYKIPSNFNFVNKCVIINPKIFKIQTKFNLVNKKSYFNQYNKYCKGHFELNLPFIDYHINKWINKFHKEYSELLFINVSKSNFVNSGVKKNNIVIENNKKYKITFHYNIPQHYAYFLGIWIRDIYKFVCRKGKYITNNKNYTICNFSIISEIQKLVNIWEKDKIINRKFKRIIKQTNKNHMEVIWNNIKAFNKKQISVVNWLNNYYIVTPNSTYEETVKNPSSLTLKIIELLGLDVTIFNIIDLSNLDINDFKLKANGNIFILLLKGETKFIT